MVLSRDRVDGLNRTSSDTGAAVYAIFIYIGVGAFIRFDGKIGDQAAEAAGHAPLGDDALREAEGAEAADKGGVAF